MISKMIGNIRNNLITGILVLAPIGAVFWIIVWLWNFLFVLSSLIPDSLRPTAWFATDSGLVAWISEFFLTIVILFLILSFLFFIGFLSRYYLGKKIFSYISRFMEHVPVFRSIYSTIQQLLGTFTSGESKSKKFSRVVLVEYPRKGMHSLAFVTGERLSANGQEKLLNIFIPTTPNPTSGFYLSVSESEVQAVDTTVEEALKEILSLGLVQKHSTKNSK